MSQLYPVIRKAAVRGISFIINTRDPVAHDDRMKAEAYRAVRALQDLDILVLYTSNLHRKVAIIDDSILWEGSLNILSHGGSAEVMRRTSCALSVAYGQPVTPEAAIDFYCPLAKF
jgi:hypothetical protein